MAWTKPNFLLRFINQVLGFQAINTLGTTADDAYDSFTNEHAEDGTHNAQSISVTGASFSQSGGTYTDDVTYGEYVSFTKQATGHVRITISAQADVFYQVIANSNEVAAFIVVDNISSTIFDVYIYDDTGTLVDSGFMFQVWGT